MNTLSNLKMPRAVCCGEGALKKMPEILQAASVKKAAVFTDKGIRSAGLLDPVLEQLQKSPELASALAALIAAQAPAK